MNYIELYEQIKKKGSFLCVGLDTDIEKIPAHLRECQEPLFEFNKAIVDATAAYAVAYKPNIAFYEAEGVAGWAQLEKTVAYIREHYPEIFIIADAKRGDIGNTADRYAKAFLDRMQFDSVTLAPYMGSDSIRPFLKYEGKWGIVLALTSNKSAEEFETLEIIEEDSAEEVSSSTGEADEEVEYNVTIKPLYQKIIEKNIEMVDTDFGTSRDRLMFVVGATRPEKLAEIREFCPDHFLLVPGVGAQGGSLAEVARYGLNSHCGLLVNSSRGIIYASTGTDFAEAAAREAKKLANEMATYL